MSQPGPYQNFPVPNQNVPNAQNQYGRSPQYPPNYPMPYGQMPAQQNQAAKKPIYKKPWFWILLVLLFPVILMFLLVPFALIFGSTDGSATNPPTSSPTEISNSPTSTPSEISDSPTPTPVDQFTKEEDYEGIEYDKLARNPDDHEGKKIKGSGNVVQVMEAGNEVQLRIATSSDGYDDIILAYYDSSIVDSRILEEDHVTYYGESLGLYTYESTLGQDITVPLVEIHKITID